MKTRATTEIAGFKTRISKACSPITALRSRVQALDQPFGFPNTAIECTVFIAEKGAELEELKHRDRASATSEGANPKRYEFYSREEG